MLSIFLVLALVGCVRGTSQPVFGVFTSPLVAGGCVTSDKYVLQGPEGTTSCFTTFYARWLEQAGARVVPVRFDLNDTELTSLLSSINGVLFTGGSLDLTENSQYVQTAQKIFDMSKQWAKEGEHFPVWGTCQGFQLLNILASQNYTLLEPFDSNLESLALDFTAAASGSRMFAGASKDVMRILGTEAVTSNLHNFGVSPKEYARGGPLPEFFNILSTNKDRNGLPFVSTVEAFDYPIYATQWHPERPQWEWVPVDKLVHTPDAVLAMQYMASFIVSEARKSTHTFSSEEEEAAALLYNYAPSTGPSSYQHYFFESV